MDFSRHISDAPIFSKEKIEGIDFMDNENSDEEIEDCFLKWSKSFKTESYSSPQKENSNSTNTILVKSTQIDSKLYEEITFGKEYSLKIPTIDKNESKH